MPALVKRSVGSSFGTSSVLATIVWPFPSKNFRNLSLISSPVIKILLLEISAGSAGK
jgi:hypothetical protein